MISDLRQDARVDCADGQSFDALLS
jgi:hypothetical protein